MNGSFHVNVINGAIALILSIFYTIKLNIKVKLNLDQRELY